MGARPSATSALVKPALKWIAAATAIGLSALLLALAWVHADIRSLNPPLPALEEVVAPRDADTSAWPVRIRYVNTGSQPMSRGLVLDSSEDPTPERPYIMSHTSFAIEWADGRLFLIDSGLPREAAIAFGKPSESLGADITQAHGGVSVQLGREVQRVAGIAFSHLHIDHTSGLAGLCDGLRGQQLTVFQAPLQFERGNYTTRDGREHLANAPCAVRKRLEDGSLLPIPGFPGLFAIQAAGHTPGSQLFVAHLPSECEGCTPQTWIFTGDVVNHIDGVRKNIPKPTWYSYLVVPESPTRLESVRRFLHRLESEHAVRLLVSHDQLQIESSGIESW